MKPNILLIMSDQQRGDCLGIENPSLLTPNLDEIASSGVRFSRAYSTCPSCIAARRSLLTGQFPSTHGLAGFLDGVEMHPDATLPGVLSENGYQTFLAGRTMHQTPRRKRYEYADRLELWRQRMIDELKDHPEEFSNGLCLKCQTHQALMPLK